MQHHDDLKPAKLKEEEEERVIAASGVTMAAHASELEIAKKNLTDAIGDNVKQWVMMSRKSSGSLPLYHTSTLWLILTWTSLYESRNWCCRSTDPYTTLSVCSHTVFTVVIVVYCVWQEAHVCFSDINWALIVQTFCFIDMSLKHFSITFVNLDWSMFG